MATPIDTTVSRLDLLLNIIPDLLNKLSEDEFSLKEQPDKWSKKEILGHLIDSATNNHQRFVRGQFEDNPFIKYDQDNWVACSHYQQMDSKQLIKLWHIYNQHLLTLIKLIPEENLQRTINSRETFTLSFIIEDYVVHMEHHLKEIIAY